MPKHADNFDKAVFYEYRGGSCPASLQHRHRSFEFFLVRKGSVMITVGDETRILFEGDAALVIPNRQHSFSTTVGCEYEACTFSPDLVPLFVRELRCASPESSFFHPRRKVEFVRGDDNTYLISGFLYEICGMFFDSVRFARSDDEDTTLINRLIRYIEDNYTEQISLSGASEKFGEDYKYLSSYFKKRTGVTFNDYVASCRINRARFLLSGTKTPITDVARACGYDTFRSFDRNFLKKTGMRPRDYRAQQR